MNKQPLSKPSRRKIVRFWVYLALLMVVVLFVLAALGPLTCSIKDARQIVCLQTAHAINLSLLSYANDHDGKYPDGKTSTDIFQQLMDQGYITDPALFYVPDLHLPGKEKPTSTHLRPENVCWDFTSGVDAASSDTLPVVFLTGYRVTYQAGASAMLLHPPPARTWAEWWNGESAWEPFMAVGYKGGNAKKMLAHPDGSIPDFVPADFDPKGKVYRQLTP